jgi:NADPH:quinone reductase-like Zn-dependent oxidoreductase
VQGGAGGVGIDAVQIAAILGGRVTATGHARQRDFVLRLGTSSCGSGRRPSADKVAALGVHAMFLVVTPDAAELVRLAALIDQGRLRPVVSQSFPLRDGRKAFESGTAPHPPGKTVLIVR